ncbi:substrate-binding domain-containing protein [Rhodococcus sp. BP-316]|uniref:VWA domain-containing protein n=1 Tax=Rhodococcus sp. BP-316 TaxID=2739445 RepID=UPI001C9B9A09|nr:VWA domain-containing protein [Rhodococcus sp. BP-316]MBY6679462.1 substrate-binding domain-containing protein [Rhodococcus sp. BP-316]
MGEHRRTASTSGGRRGVSRGPVVVVVVLVLLVAAVLGWFALRDRITDEGEQAAKACVEGDAVLAVTADPDIADAVRTVAAAWDATAPVVRDHCVTTTVTETASDVAAAALAADPYDAAAGPRPSLWIPATSADAAPLIDARRVDSTPRSLATSPVVLGVAPTLADTLGAAAVGWADLPRLAATPGSLDAIGAVGWGSLRPALPAGSTTTAALVSVAAAVVDPTASTAPLTADQAASAPVVSAVSALSRAATDETPTPPADAAAALDAMVQGDDPAAAPVHAVPVTEQQLYGRITEGQQLAAFRPAGSTPSADHPAVVLSDGDATGRAAAAAFAEFARGADQQQAFLRQGFRVPTADGTTEATPPSVAGLTFPAIGQPAASPEPAARTAVLDVSGSMESIDGSATRLTNVTSALRQVIGAVPDTSRIGLWTYSRALDGSRPYRVEVPLTEANSESRAALDSSLAGLSPATATSTYASAQAAYESAVQNWSGDGTNSVLLVTDGPNDDTSISAASFLQSIAAASDPARPVRIDVVSLTQNSDIATLRSLAGQTGGDLVEVSSSDPSLTATLDRLSSDR